MNNETMIIIFIGLLIVGVPFAYISSKFDAWYKTYNPKINLIRKEEKDQLDRLKQIEWGVIMYKLERFYNPKTELEFSKNPHEERIRIIEQINAKYGHVLN